MGGVVGRETSRRDANRGEAAPDHWLVGSVIRLLIADDHGIVREGLQRLFATVPGVEVVGTAADGAEAVALADQTVPDVVLMDVGMPQVDGVEATRRITAAHPASRIVMLTAHGERPASEMPGKPARPDTSSRTPLRMRSSGRSRPRTLVSRAWRGGQAGSDEVRS